MSCEIEQQAQQNCSGERSLGSFFYLTPISAGNKDIPNQVIVYSNLWADVFQTYVNSLRIHKFCYTDEITFAIGLKYQ